MHANCPRFLVGLVVALAATSLVENAETADVDSMSESELRAKVKQLRQKVDRLEHRLDMKQAKIDALEARQQATRRGDSKPQDRRRNHRRPNDKEDRNDPLPALDLEPADERKIRQAQKARAGQLTEQIKKLRRQGPRAQEKDPRAANFGSGSNQAEDRRQARREHAERIRALDRQRSIATRGHWLPRVDPDTEGSVGAISDAWAMNHGADSFRQAGRVHSLERDGRVGVVQVVNDSAALVRLKIIPGTNKPANWIWVSNIDTSAMRDGHAAWLNGIYQTVGSTRYKTATGSQQVAHVKRLGMTSARIKRANGADRRDR